MRYVANWLVGRIKVIGFWVFQKFSTSRTFQGLELWAMANFDDDGLVLDRIEAAVELIAEVDPLRFRRVQRFLKRIVVADHQGAVYVPEVNACVIGLTKILNESASRVAASIVHEAAHARVRSRGIAASTKTLAREERLCVKESLAFLERSGDWQGVASLRALVESELQSGKPWFHPDRQWDRFGADMRKAGVPEWIVRLRRSIRL